MFIVFLYRFVLFTSICFFTGPSIYPQHADNLVSKIKFEAGLKILLKKNAQILHNKAALISFEGIRDKARFSIIPTLKLLSFIAPTFQVKGNALEVKRDFSKWGVYLQNNLQIVWPFYQFGSISLTKKAANQGLAAYKLLHKSKINEQIYEYKKLYLSSLLLKQLQGIIQEAKIQLDEILANAQKVYASGSGKVLSKDIARLSIYQVEIEKLQEDLSSNKKIVQLAIGHFLGELTSYEAFDEEFPELDEELFSLKQLLDLSLQKNPDLEALSLGILARKNFWEAQKKSILPVFFIGLIGNANYSNVREDQDSSFAHDPYNKFDIGVAAGFNWEFDWGGYKSKTKKAESEYKQILAQRKEAQTGYPLEISKAFWEMKSNHRKWRLAQKKLKAAKKWQASEFTSHSSGLGETKDLLEALAAFYFSQKEVLEAEYNYLTAWANVCWKVGQASMLEKWNPME